VLEKHLPQKYKCFEKTTTNKQKTNKKTLTFKMSEPIEIGQKLAGCQLQLVSIIKNTYRKIGTLFLDQRCL